MAAQHSPASVERAAGHPQVVGEVLAIPCDAVEIGVRLRPIDSTAAEALAAVMARDGQQEDIKVCRLPGRSSFLLVAGGHRLTAARINGWATIRAQLVSADPAERALIEISDNLIRTDLSALDRAFFVGEFYRVTAERLGRDVSQKPQSIAAQARWKKTLKEQASDASATIADAYGLDAKVGQNFGLSERTVRNDLAIHRGLAPAIVTRLRGLPIASNAGQLQALAKLSEADQRAVVGLLSEGKAKGVSDALGILRQKPPADPAKKAWSAFFGGWSRMNARRRREALRELAEQGLPTGVRIVFDEDADG